MNGTLRVRGVAETANPAFFTATDSNGLMQKVKPYRIVATHVDQASGNFQMTTVTATYTETIDNTAGTIPISNTYQLQAYYEHYDDTLDEGTTGGNIRYHMWSATEPNYNWGRATLS